MKHIEDKKVRDLMTYGVVTVPEYAKVINVIRILNEGHVHGVIVVGKEGKASGVVSEIDISKAFGRDLDEVTAEEIMSKPVKTIDINATINEAAKIMREGGFDRLVILDKNDFPRGLLSVTDIIKEIVM
jgi:CBS domain-containing protein